MTMMDDKNWIISHIRNSFITSDDTGVCEMVMQPEMMQDAKKERSKSVSIGNLKRNQRSVPCDLRDSSMNSEGDSLSNSPDILPDMDFGAHRLRTNTALRLERMKKEKTTQTKIRHIPWREPDKDYNVDEQGHLYEKKCLDFVEGKKKKRLSLLSAKLEETSKIPDNPFQEFAKFDGRQASSSSTKKIGIFLTMMDEENRVRPMTVVTLATARVIDLIGLICWQYTYEGRVPPLTSNLECHSLHIAEDDGEVDLDFPCLDNQEPMSKFGFTNLALVQKLAPPSSPKPAIVITVNIPDKGFSKLNVENDQVLMKDILAKVLHKRKVKDKGLQYNLEKQCEPGLPIELDLPLAAMETREFCLVRENSSRGMYPEFLEDLHHNTLAESLSSHQYKSYRVSMNHKLRTSTDVQLGISGEKVEIDPVSGKGATKLFRQKAVTYEAEMIAACDIMEERPTGKASFRLTYLSKAHTHDFKHHDFDADVQTAREIVQKVNNILELRSSPVRKDYLTMREKKLHKRYSFPT